MIVPSPKQNVKNHKIMTNKIIPKIADIHIGDRTHSQLQEMIPINLSTINTIVSSPTNTIPVFVFLLFSILVSPFSNSSTASF